MVRSVRPKATHLEAVFERLRDGQVYAGGLMIVGAFEQGVSD